MNEPDQRGCRTQLCRHLETSSCRGLYFHHHEIHTLFDELIHRPWGSVQWSPAVDVWENDRAFTIDMDLPGVTADQVEIHAQGRVLVIEGRREIRQIAGQTAAHLHERCEGKFARTFEFDYNAEGQAIETRWQDGVLTVTVPKPKKE